MRGLPFDRRGNGCVGGLLVPESAEDWIGNGYENYLIPVIEDANEYLGRSEIALLGCSATGIGASVYLAPAAILEVGATATDVALAYDKCVAYIDFGGECLYNVIFAWMPAVTNSAGDDIAEASEVLLKRVGGDATPVVHEAANNLIQAVIFQVFDEIAIAFER